VPVDSLDLSKLRRVLVIKLRHHGDVLLASPVFSVLKNHAPHLEIDALVYRDTVDMVAQHPSVEQVHAVDRNWKRLGIFGQLGGEWQLLSKLRERRYDLVIHLTEHNRGAWLVRLLNARYSVAEKRHSKGYFWRNTFSHFYLRVAKGNARHTVESHLDVLRRIGVRPNEDERRLILVAGEDAETFVDQELERQGLSGQPFIHLHPTSRWLFKCWPEKNMSMLIDTLQAQGHRIVLTAAPNANEMAMIWRIVAPLDRLVVNLSGKLSLKQLAALAAKAKLFIGVDSAPMHIAAAMQTPVVALFGPSGEMEWGPWMTHCLVLTSSHSCRPCGLDGCGGSKLSDCLSAIPVVQVCDAVRNLLADGCSTR
jgi:heptosyltransferase-3